MNLRQIETFLAVIEEGTFSAGATRLKVSQPTVSKLIDALERGLGYKLFRRMGVRVVPTDQGMALYREMTRVKRGFDLLLDQARDLKVGGSARLVVGAGSAEDDDDDDWPRRRYDSPLACFYDDDSHHLP